MSGGRRDEAAGCCGESFRIGIFLTSEMSSTLCRDPVCSCPITDYRGLRLDANELWLHFKKKTSVAAINITLGVPGQRADK